MEIEGDHAVHIEIEPLANSLRSELDALCPLSDQCTIYRVAEDVRELDEKAYTPRIISIGPIHHVNEKFKAMEKYKRRYLQDFLERTEVNLESFIKEIKEKEERIRDCYAESIELTSDESVKMVLIDAVFIIEVMWRSFIEEPLTSDRIYACPRKILEIKDDMYMLENQLPFFVLEDLFMLANLTIDNSNIENSPISMLKITHEFSKPYWGRLGIEEILEENRYSGGVKHLLDFLSISIGPRNSGEERQPIIRTAPSVTELHHSGVKFKLSSDNNLFQLRFSKGVLEIPRITIGISTKYILKNLLALEKSQSGAFPLNDYIRIINCLCGTTKDLKLLVEKGIIEYHIGDDEAASALIHELGERTVMHIHHFYFSSLAEDLNRYYNNPWHKWKAILMEDYFKTPWATFSIIAAVILLILTIVQALCSVLQVI